MPEPFDQDLYDRVMAELQEEPILAFDPEYNRAYTHGATVAARIAAEREHRLDAQIETLALILMDEFGGPTKSESACEMAVRVLREQAARIAAEQVPDDPYVEAMRDIAEDEGWLGRFNPPAERVPNLEGDDEKWKYVSKAFGDRRWETFHGTDASVEQSNIEGTKAAIRRAVEVGIVQLPSERVPAVSDEELACIFADAIEAEHNQSPATTQTQLGQQIIVGIRAVRAALTAAAKEEQ